jgi:uncharacterized protein with PIN domain
VSDPECPACGAQLVERIDDARRRVPFEWEDGAWRYETVAVFAWRCSGCKSIVWREGVSAPLQVDPPER